MSLATNLNTALTALDAIGVDKSDNTAAESAGSIVEQMRTGRMIEMSQQVRQKFWALRQVLVQAKADATNGSL